MKGIILAGGSGTRLFPATIPVCKQLLPVYDKPMVYYPLSLLIEAGIREVLVISTAKDIGRFEEILGDGTKLGLTIKYMVQKEPKGLAEALILGEDFIDGDTVCLILGDNILHGQGLGAELKKARQSVETNGGAYIFGYFVNDPERYGVVGFDATNQVISIEEKPAVPQSNYAVIGLYFYDNKAAAVAKKITPSERGELEITSVNQAYLTTKKLKVGLLGRGYAWFDAGTHESLLEASEFVMTIEKRTGLKIGCIEEAAYEQKFISEKELLVLAKPLMKSGYGDYLQRVVKLKDIPRV